MDRKQFHAHNYTSVQIFAKAHKSGTTMPSTVGLGGIDIHRSQIMAAARWTNPVKCTVRRS